MPIKTKNLFGEEVAMPKGREDEGYIYIAQNNNEKSRCKIGITIDLKQRLQHYNSTTGKSASNETTYIFTCSVKSMLAMENAIKKEFLRLREKKEREIYFFNETLFEEYVNFIKKSEYFIKQIHYKEFKPEKIVKIIPKTKPSLSERGETWENILKAAKRKKNDEFYTRFEDVKKEVEMHEESIWKNKIVFCNCDDPVDEENHRSSAFANYFLQNFARLKLKKLICLHYAGGEDIFRQGPKGYIFTKTGFSTLGKKEFPKDFDGSFDHPVSLKILKEEADIVCTNPPFSRMIDFWKTIVDSGKKFLIISNLVNVLNTAYIHYFYDKKVWAGFDEIHWYLNPKKELTRAAGQWFTNFPIKDRPRYSRLKIISLKDIPDKFKKRDDDDVLLLDNCYIPNDYKKPFAISATPILSGVLEKGYKLVNNKQYVPYINGKACFARVLVQREN